MPPQIRKIIRGKVVVERVGKSRVQIWRDVRADLFPLPVEIGPNAIGWFEDEIDAWLASRPRRTYGTEAEAAKEYKTAEVGRQHQQQERRREVVGQAKEARE